MEKERNNIHGPHSGHFEDFDPEMAGYRMPAAFALSASGDDEDLAGDDESRYIESKSEHTKEGQTMPGHERKGPENNRRNANSLSKRDSLSKRGGYGPRSPEMLEMRRMMGIPDEDTRPLGEILHEKREFNPTNFIGEEIQGGYFKDYRNPYFYPEEPVQKKEADSPESTESPGSLTEAGDGGTGGDLPPDTSENADLSGVRIHPDSEKAGELGAKAFTQGRDIHFAPGEYDPGSREGQQLIGHELAHVVQQQQGKVTATGSEAGLPVNTDPALEQEADDMAAQLAPAAPALQADTLNASYAAPVQKKEDPCAPQLEAFRGASVNLPGRISADAANYKAAVSDGMKLRAKPLPALPEIARLPYGEEVFVQAENFSGGWYFVVSQAGTAGWIRADFVATDMPDPEARLHHVTEGDLTTILKQQYIDTGRWELETGNDYTTLAAAVAVANSGRAGVDIDAKQFEKYYAEHGFRTTVDPWMAENFATYHAVRIKSGHNIWLPSPGYIRTLQASGLIGSRPGWMNTAIDVGKSIAGFVAGYKAGLYGGVWDMLTGLWEMGKQIVGLIKGIFSGEIFAEIKKIYDELTRKGIAGVAKELWEALSMAVEEGIDDFVGSWTHPNAFKKWFFRGKVLGVVTLEVALAIFTAGAGTAVSLLARVAKVSPRLAKVLARAIGLAEDAVPNKMRKSRRAADRAEDVVEGAGDNRKSREALALSAARGITEWHDAKGSSIAELMLSLKGVERFFKPVRGHGAIAKEPGHFRIVQFSKKTVDADYTPGKETEGNDEHKVINEEPGNKKEGWNRTLNEGLEPNAIYHVGGYVYETDELGRVKRVTGELRLNKRDRNSYQQRKSVSIKDGKEGDDGGHIVASIFDGPGEQINYWPQEALQVNRGKWRRMENYCANKLKEIPPKKVEIDFVAHYDGNSKRPVGFTALVKAAGEVEEFNIRNL